MKKNKHQLRSEQTKAKLINKLAEIIRNGEIDRFNIRDLCGELGLSPRTFYLYFESKEHAINQAYIYQEEILKEKIDAVNANVEDPWERLMNIFKAAIQLSKEEIVTVQRRLISVLRVYDDYIHSSQTVIYTTVKNELDQCINEKKMKFTLPTDQLAWELIMFYRGIVYNHLTGHGHYPILDDGVVRLERFAKTFIEKS